MSKSLIIDFELLNNLDISVNEFLYLYNIYTDFNLINLDTDMVDIDKLENKRLIKVYDNSLALRQDGINLIEMLLIDNNKTIKEENKNIKKSDRLINEEVNNNIKEFRELWRGLKPGSMGSLQSCKDKMKRWIKNNPEYSFDDIINAAKLYLNTEGRNIRFLQRADYFIYKQSNNREEESRLSAFIDDTAETDDWTSKLN